MTENIGHYFKENQTELLKEYFTLLSFPSISSEEGYKEATRNCAEWIVTFLQSIGMNVSLWETSGHPIVFAEDLSAGPNQPTLLLYNHYDVQPVDPLELWESPPFSPTQYGDQIRARGAQDNKGQCFYVLQALKYYRTVEGKLPINIKLVIEGEEECGSEGLIEILDQKRNELRADYVAIVDLGIPDRETPAITLGLRGLVTLDIKATGPNGDLHSGSHGGLQFNPIHALVDVLSKLRDPSGEIMVPGFYDSMIPMPLEEKKQLALEFNEEKYRAQFGSSATGGEVAFSPLERNWLRPTLEINGIWGGYNGSGFKTVIPAQAFAKISCRLVPGQDPKRIGELVVKTVESLAPKGVKIEAAVRDGGGPAVRGGGTSKIVRAVAEAYEEAFKKKCQFILEGASIPVVSQLSATCGGETVLFGLGLPDDHIHAPNEHFGIDRIELGLEIIVKIIKKLQNKGH